MEWHRFALIAGAHFLALLSPGPDFFLIVRSSLVQGARAGAIASLGVALANGMFIVAAISGLTVLRDQPAAYAVLYWSGCVYLAWLGWRFWQAAQAHGSESVAGGARVTHRALLLTGFLSGALNPKNALFYLALFTLMLDRTTGTAWQIACGAWMFCAVLAWDCAVARAVGHPRVMAAFVGCLGRVHRTGALLLWAICGSLLGSGLLHLFG
ncbi:LysE family translocator [Paludibacterium yongneupense]|uniref:LysE family translocator n=1 Tax=Paludibacterium yongneupense TaxID=400061 RepID=UPI0004109F82|nr:LysE family translocator [Paludibacterium yongneupense]